MNTTTRNLHWPLVIGLGAFALIRPLFSIVGLSDVFGRPGTPLVLSAVITAVWVLGVGLSRVQRPVATLVAAGIVYAVLAAILSAILSPILSGELRGPLASPIGIIPLLLTNIVWGFIAGGLALVIQRLRGVGRPGAPTHTGESRTHPRPSGPDTWDRR